MPRNVCIHGTNFAVTKPCDVEALKTRVLACEEMGYISMESVGYHDNQYARVFVWKKSGETRELKATFNVDCLDVNLSVKDYLNGVRKSNSFVALDDVIEYVSIINA